MRAGSKQANSSKDRAIMDVNPQAVTEAMHRYNTPLLIHGHTHRPAVHQLEVNGQPAQRLVLGAWHQQGSMIKVSADEIRLISLPL